MLKEVKFIQNIGRFETAKPTHDTTFGPCTLVFGENGWGKVFTLQNMNRLVECTRATEFRTKPG